MTSGACIIRGRRFWSKARWHWMRIGDRYFIAPVDQAHEDWLAALREAGFEIALDYERDRFIVHRLRPPKN